MIEGPNARDHIALCAFHSFVVEVQMNVGYVVVQLYPWFKFSLLLFLGMIMYDNNMIISLKQKKRKFEPRIKLNHNRYIHATHV